METGFNYNKDRKKNWWIDENIPEDKNVIPDEIDQGDKILFIDHGSENSIVHEGYVQGVQYLSFSIVDDITYVGYKPDHVDTPDFEVKTYDKRKCEIVGAEKLTPPMNYG